MTEIAHDLYEQIVGSMPIPCVDLLIRDEENRVLLVHRRNEPARNEWWFPGGRVHFFEDRRDAVTRKLKEETGLEATNVRERGTYEIFFDVSPTMRRHSITTLYDVAVAHPVEVTLDEQSGDAAWLTPVEWLRRDLPPFVRIRLEEWAN